jgi:CTP:molybdopterin cytidylyltransferase MocA
VAPDWLRFSSDCASHHVFENLMNPRHELLPKNISPRERGENRRVKVLVLAGSRSPTDPVAEVGGKSAKAFVEVGGIPMIERVIDTLRESGCCATIQVSLPAHFSVQEESPRLFAWLRAGVVEAVEPESSPAQSVLQAFPDPSGPPILLVTTCDHPLLSSAMVRELLDAFEESGADAVAGIVNTNTIRARYPNIKRTAIRFRDGPMTGCNLFAFRGDAGASVVRYWTRLEGHRKKPLRMARSVGIVTLLLYAAGWLTLDGALERLGRRLGVRLLAARLTDIHAGIDVDTPEDLEAVQKIFAARMSQNDPRIAL